MQRRAPRPARRSPAPPWCRSRRPKPAAAPGRRTSRHRRRRTGSASYRPSAPAQRRQRRDAGMFEQQAGHRHRQAADADLQAADAISGIAIGSRLASMVPSANTEGADQRHDDARQLCHAGVECRCRPSARRCPANAITSASMRGSDSRSPRIEPGQQRRPYRHGVGDHRGLAGRQPQQREPHQRHPARDVEQRRPATAAATGPAAPAGFARASAPSSASSSRADHAGQAARRQRRPFGSGYVRDRPVESPADRGDGEEHRPAGAMRAVAPGRFGSVMELEFPGWNRAATCRLSARLTIGRRACQPGPVRSSDRESRQVQSRTRTINSCPVNSGAKPGSSTRGNNFFAWESLRTH